MKKVLFVVGKAVVLGLVVWLGCSHLEHSAALGGYIDGCKDTILEGAKVENLQIPDDVLTNYCENLSQKYVEKK